MRFLGSVLHGRRFQAAGIRVVFPPEGRHPRQVARGDPEEGMRAMNETGKYIIGADEKQQI